MYASGHIMRFGIYAMIYFKNTIHVLDSVSAGLPSTRPPLVPTSLPLQGATDKIKAVGISCKSLRYVDGDT